MGVVSRFRGASVGLFKGTQERGTPPAPGGCPSWDFAIHLVALGPEPRKEGRVITPRPTVAHRSKE
jgi:hypothetical protein